MLTQRAADICNRKLFLSSLLKNEGKDKENINVKRSEKKLPVVSNQQ